MVLESIGCPKCGGRMDVLRFVAMYSAGCVGDGCRWDGPTGEHLHRSCSRCLYLTAEPTADAPVPSRPVWTEGV